MSVINHPLAGKTDVDLDFEHKLPGSKSPLNKSSVTSPTTTSIKNPLYPLSEIIEPLRPEEVRWFYKEDGTTKWIHFEGYDSLRIECKYREIIHNQNKSGKYRVSSKEERICVRGSLYEVSVPEQKCYPIYWHQKGIVSCVIDKYVALVH